MEFGKHIDKGFWAFADKSLPVIYGIGFIFLVIRTLSETEFGAFVIIQTIFILTTTLGYAFAFQPLTKFAAATEDNCEYISSSILLGLLFFVALSITILILKPIIAPFLDRTKSGVLEPLIIFLPLLYATAFYRSLAISYLLAKYQVKKIFWIDAVYLLGALILIYLSQLFYNFASAADLIIIIIISQLASSLLAFIFTRKAFFVKLIPKREALMQTWNFGKYSFSANITYSIFAQMDVFFISSFAGIYYVAIYNAAKILTRIFDMISQVLIMFLIPFSSKYYSRNEIDRLIVVAEKTICFSTILLLPVFIAMFFFPEQLLYFLYQGKYSEGAMVIRIFSVLAFTTSLNAVSSSYMAGMGKVKESLFLGLGLLIFSTIFYSVLTPYLGIEGTSLSFVCSLVGLTIGATVFVHKSISFKFLGVILRLKDVYWFLKTILTKKNIL